MTAPIMLATYARLDLEHECSMVAYHQRWVTRLACLFTITGVLAFVVSPWLFASAGWWLLMLREARGDRNRAADRVRGLEAKIEAACR